MTSGLRVLRCGHFLVKKQKHFKETAMAFTSAVSLTTVFGNKRVAFGTYGSTGGGTGGSVNTNLSTVENFILQPNNATILASESVTNATFPTNGGMVPIVTNADEVGNWMATGL